MVRSTTWLAIAVLLAACGGAAQSEPGIDGGAAATPAGAASAPASEAPATVEQPGGAAIGDACAMLTLDEIATALGEPVGPGEFAGMEGAPGCSWRAVDATSESSVGLLIVTGGDAYARDAYGQGTSDLSIAGADEAFAIESGTDAAAVNIRVGGVRILMDADTRSDDTVADDAFVAALGRLAEIVVKQVRP